MFLFRQKVNLEDYQKFVEDITLPSADNWFYGVTNLCSEAGEVAEAQAKAMRDKWSLGELKSKTSYELGDVLFMVAHLCNQFDLSLEEVLENNKKKLTDRKENGTLQGSGDDR